MTQVKITFRVRLVHHPHVMKFAGIPAWDDRGESFNDLYCI